MRWHLAAVALHMLAACGPDAGPEFDGEYIARTPASSVCRHHHPEAAPYFLVMYLGDPIVFEEDDAGTISVPLPMPPCPITGTVHGDELRLRAEDCVVHSEGNEHIELFDIEYEDGVGLAVFDHGLLEVTIETSRRYTSVPAGLPDWWDAPGSCDMQYSLEPL